MHSRQTALLKFYDLAKKHPVAFEMKLSYYFKLPEG